MAPGEWVLYAQPPARLVADAVTPWHDRVVIWTGDTYAAIPTLAVPLLITASPATGIPPVVALADIDRCQQFAQHLL